jgi:hypothetical protein
MHQQRCGSGDDDADNQIQFNGKQFFSDIRISNLPIDYSK